MRKLLFLFLTFFISTAKLSAQNNTIQSVRIVDGKVIKVTYPSGYVAKHNNALLSDAKLAIAGNKTNKQNGTIALTVFTTSTKCNASYGSIVIQASGGTPPYVYEIKDAYATWVSNNGNFQFLNEGNYSIKVTDAAGVTATDTVVVANVNNKPILTYGAHTNASGCAAKDASVTLLATGGTPPYAFTIDDVNFQSSNVFSNLYSGGYIFIVKDANGCEDRFGALDFNGFINCNIAFGVNYTIESCKPSTIYGDVVSTNGPYTFSLDGINYQSNYYFDNLLPGLHNVHIKDKDGTDFVYVVPILPYCNIRIDFISVDAACGGSDGVLTVNASQGKPPYTYSIDGINYISGNVFSGLRPGNYGINVKDADGVMDSQVATIYDRCPQVTATATDATCPGNNNGVITVTAVKGTAPYTYSLDSVTFQASNIFNGLAAGNYTVTIKDAMGFTSKVDAEVKYNCITIASTLINSTCNQSNGTISITATNGIAPYIYSIDGVSFFTSGLFVNLPAGSYTVTVKDFTGLTVTSTVIVQNTPGPTLATSMNPAGCSGNDGDITATGAGGTMPYQFSLDGTNYQSGNVFSNLSTGIYMVSIKDATGCINSKLITVTTSCPTLSTTLINETCSNKNGSIKVSGSSGTPPYQFSIDGVNFQTVLQFSNLSAGNYTITIKDAAGITNTNNVTIANICPTVTTVVTDGLCSTAKGVITATGSNGVAPYQYSFDGINFQAGNIFSNLSSGSYTVTVKDAGGLTNTTKVVVNNFPGPVLSVSVFSATCVNNNGKIELATNGGTLPVQYSINGTDFISGAVFSNLAAGNYTAFVKDANGCNDNKPAVIIMNNNLTLSMGTDVTICEGTKIQLPAISNAATFSWSPASNLTNSSVLNPEASPVIDTKYDLTASLGQCTLTGTVNVNVNPAPIANAGNNMEICFGKDAILQGSGGLEYIWSPITYLANNFTQNPLVQKPQNSITYSLVVKDNNQCSSLNSETVTVTVTPPAKLFAGNDTSIVMNQPFQLMAHDVNTSGFITYKWQPSFGLNNPGIKDPVTVLDRDLKYTVTAITGAGCEGSDDILVKVYRGPEIYVPAAFTPNGDGLNDLLKAIPVGIKEFKYFKIFNRYGQEVFSTTDPAKGWNGRFKQVAQGVNNFIWMAEGVDGTGNMVLRKGSVMLIK